MEDTAIVEVPPDPVPEASPMPWVFTCAVWVPTFAVVLWIMLRLFGPRAEPPRPETDDG